MSALPSASRVIAAPDDTISNFSSVELTSAATRGGWPARASTASQKSRCEPAEVGSAVAKSGLPREDVYLVTKLWNADHGYGSTLAAFDASMDRLGLSGSDDYLDLYLIHWPMPAKNAFVATRSRRSLTYATKAASGRSASATSNRNICRSWWTAPELSRPSIRSSCTRCCSSRNCGKCTPNWASPPRRGVRWARDHC